MATNKTSQARSVRVTGLSLCLTMLFSFSCGDDEVKPTWHQGIDDAVSKVMDIYDMPGLSLALVKDESLVYVASYGYADVESGEKTTSNSLFRIASISKVFTGVTILHLVNNGIITLDQTVFGADGILGNDYGTPPDGSQIDLVTVRHLLNHRSGWTNDPYDPVLTYSTSTQAELITDMVTNRPLTYDPGSTGYYLNFGYLVLGRVIEKVTGLAYDTYVKNEVMTPLGITAMKIGGNTLAERYPSEVKYYANGTIVTNGAYINDVEKTDAAGGWIASATDLVRLIVRIDKNPGKADLIPPDLINQINYMANTSWLHTGTIFGASGILTKLDNTYSLAVLFNVFTEDGAFAIRDAVKQELSSVKEWPEEDLF